MTGANRKDHRTLFMGCGLAILIVLLGIAGLVVVAYNQQQDVARYPGSVPLPHYTRYIARPYYIHHATVYQSSGLTSEVEKWYTNQLGLHMILDEGECRTFGRTDKDIGLVRTTTVLICASLQNQVISVTRAVSLR